jgi:putative salt-induced outer membrane protein YdiY
MNLTKTLSTVAATLSVALSFLAQSDQIILTNGDILTGTLVSQDDTYIEWESDSLGTLKIPNVQVSSIKKKNIDLVPTKLKEKPLFTANVGLSGAYMDGNEQRDDLELNIGFSFEKENTIHNTLINYETLGSKNESTINDYGIKYVIDWSISENWYWGNNFFYGADDKRQIDQSISVGTNMGYQFWKNDQGKLTSEIGLTWSGEYQKRLVRKFLLSYSHQLNVSIKDSDNSQLNADLGIIIPVTEQLDTKISWDWSFDNQPEQDNEKIDRKLKFGLDYRL